MAALTRDMLTRQQTELAKVCVHEASHALTATVLGGRIAAAVVTGGDERGEVRGHTTFALLPLGQHDAWATFAGPYAAARWLHDRRPGTAEVWAEMGEGCGSDQALLAAAGGSYLGAQVIPLVDRCWSAVCNLAGVIAKNNVARHRDVIAALGLSADPDTAAVELALIRSGRAPRSFQVSRPAGMGGPNTP